MNTRAKRHVIISHRKEICAFCNGWGGSGFGTCAQCHGTGRAIDIHANKQFIRKYKESSDRLFDSIIRGWSHLIKSEKS